MKVGLAKAEITPLAGVPLSGYRARAGVAEGIHDHLYSRAIAMEGPEDPVVLISVEVLALSASLVMDIRQGIAKATSIPFTNILVAATHTRSDPHIIQTFFNADDPLDESYMSLLAAAIIRSGIDAWETRAAARVGAGCCRVEAIGANRRNPGQGQVDRQTGIIRVDRLDGSPMAVAVIYGCHPTVLGVGNLVIAADFPAAAIETLEKEAGANVFALFLNGAADDISIGHSSALSAIGRQTEGRTFEKAWVLGERLAGAVLQAQLAIQTAASTAIKVAHRDDFFEGRQFPSIHVLKREVSDAHQRAALARAGSPDGSTAGILVEEVYAEARYNNARLLETLNKIIPIELVAIRIGLFVFVGVPAEVFTETGLRIKSSIYERAFILGMANGYIGYLAATDAFAKGGYEVEVALCDASSEQRLLQSVRQMVGALLSEASINRGDGR